MLEAETLLELLLMGSQPPGIDRGLGDHKSQDLEGTAVTTHPPPGVHESLQAFTPKSQDFRAQDARCLQARGPYLQMVLSMQRLS